MTRRRCKAMASLAALPALPVLMLLAGCDTAGQGAGSGAGQGADAAAAQAVQPGDATLACPQIATEIARQNAIIAHESAVAKAGGGSGVMQGQGPSSATSQTPTDSASFGIVPGSQSETGTQLAADEAGQRAVARANALVQLGRSKSCFR